MLDKPWHGPVLLRVRGTEAARLSGIRIGFPVYDSTLARDPQTASRRFRTSLLLPSYPAVGLR